LTSPRISQRDPGSALAGLGPRDPFSNVKEASDVQFWKLAFSILRVIAQQFSRPMDVSSDGGDKDLHLQTDATIRARLKNSRAKSKSLRAELERSIAVTALLDSTVRERTELILQLSRENESLESEIQSLSAQIGQNEQRIVLLQKAAAEKDCQFDSMVDDRRAIELSVQKLNAELGLHADGPARLEDERKVADSLRLEIECLKERLTEMGSEWTRLREEVVADKPSAISVLLAFPEKGSAEKDEPTENGRINEAIEVTRKELQLVQSKRSASETALYNRQRQKFAEQRCATLLEVTQKSKELRAESESLVELRRTLSEAQAMIASRRAVYGPEFAQYAEVKAAFDELRNVETKLQSVYETELVTFFELKTGIESKRRLLGQENEKLERLRREHLEDFLGLQRIRWQIEELKCKSLSYSNQFREYREQLSVIEKEEAELEKARTDGRAVLQHKQQIEEEHAMIETRLAECAAPSSAQTEFEKALDLHRVESQRLSDRENELQNRAARLELAQSELNRDIKTWNEARKATNRKSKSGKVAPATTNGGLDIDYLKQVCLQFFIHDASAQDSLIPVMLRLLECSDEETQVAQRKWSESRQLINRSFWRW
jgi:hypothetical protein